MDILVQKFGGTSVATKDLRERVAQKVIETKACGKFPVVVVSAIGRNGDPYATDTLLKLSKSIYPELTSRELDLLMSCGEIISAVLMTNTIKSKGYDAVALTGFQAGIITDSNFGEAQVISVNPTRIINYLKDDKIVVITGFQGATKDGDITTLGRGGSDTSAAILGEALNAEVVEIYTDVDGVMTADPRLVSEANVIQSLCYNEVYQMAKCGAKVIHPKAVEIAERANLTLKVKNTFNDTDGTIINNKRPFSVIKTNESYSKKLVTAVAHMNDIVQVIINISSEDEKNDSLLMELTDKRISIDMINFFDDRKIFTIAEKDLQTIRKILDSYNLEYKITENCSKVTIIGYKMHGVPGVMARLARALSRENIKILQSSDSNTTISCLINSKDLINAVRILHQEFEL
ncbi:aspartate kinase [Paramaledivibacter caminithermalis]|uniref:Aspartokinase n=1 Tax=Paramaledivibacter caminithermalis (strain DSM 15212 / CIP 107654 / DViRD3) TaxID=1121301 RepID=A0A1M6N4R3_PARC5|nr:aspartate kinase [Paramaledivibacter caminithermalis]SHJ90705.1 aspartate kinase [Paramaledivibacter caminithermalis DSM 15212]